jgi:hypothetical protein
VTITYNSYNTVAGSYSIVISELAFIPAADIIKIKREGFQYDLITSGTPVNRQVLYTAKSGKLTFDTPHGINAKVYVLYQH